MSSRANKITQTTKKRVVYRSLAPDLALLPQTQDLATLINEEAVKQSIKNLIFTYPGERFYHPDLGSTITKDVFEFVDEFTMDRIKETILQTLQAYEPRAQNPRVTVEDRSQDNYIIVNVYFNIAAVPESASVASVQIRIR